MGPRSMRIDWWIARFSEAEYRFLVFLVWAEALSRGDTNPTIGFWVFMPISVRGAPQGCGIRMCTWHLQAPLPIAYSERPTVDLYRIPSNLRLLAQLFCGFTTKIDYACPMAFPTVRPARMLLLLGQIL